MSELIFNKEKHKYTWNGLKLISVTQAIQKVFGKREWYSDWHANRGTAVHLAIHYLIQNKLNWESIDHRIENRIKAFQKFCIETQAMVTGSEIRLFSKKYLFAGTLDLLLEIEGQLIIADIKSTIEPIVNLQLGAYALLYEENNKVKIKKTCGIELKDNGNYSILWLQKKELEKSKNIFLKVLDIAKWKEQNYE